MLRLSSWGPAIGRTTHAEIKSNISLWMFWFLPWENNKILSEERLPQRPRSKLGEETTRGNHVNMRVYKVELRVNLEQSRSELEQKDAVE